jgi:hypothetical protein
MLSRWLLAVALLILTPTAWLPQGNASIQMRPVRAQKLVGIVTMAGDNSQGISGVHVEECDAEWQHVLASTMTDDKGEFHLAPARKGPIHRLRIYAPGFDVSEYPVKLSRFAPAELHLEIRVGT